MCWNSKFSYKSWRTGGPIFDIYSYPFELWFNGNTPYEGKGASECRYLSHEPHSRHQAGVSANKSYCGNTYFLQVLCPLAYFFKQFMVLSKQYVRPHYISYIKKNRAFNLVVTAVPLNYKTHNVVWTSAGGVRESSGPVYVRSRYWEVNTSRSRQIAASSQLIFSNDIFKKAFVFWFIFHWNLLQMAQLNKSQHWFI